MYNYMLDDAIWIKHDKERIKEIFIPNDYDESEAVIMT